MKTLVYPVFFFTKKVKGSEKMKKKLFKILGISVLFIILGYIVNNTDMLYDFDKNIIEKVQGYRTSNRTAFFKGISFLGSYVFYIPFSIVLVIFMISRKKIKYSISYVIAILLSTGINKLLKELYLRERPTEYFLVNQGGHSFPSGHAMVTTTVFLMIAYILSKESQGKKFLFYSLAYIYIFLMALSRVYLGVHWPTDVIGGFLGGSVVFLIVTFLNNEEKEKWR